MDVLGFLEDLINIPSISGEEEKIAKRVKSEFKSLGYDSVMEVEGNVCGRIGSGEKILLYDAHMDVVEPGQGWKEDPFKARKENNFIIGRGTSDNKSSLASMIYGGIKAKTRGLSLYVLASVCEEVHKGNGLIKFLKSTGIKPDWVVIGEPSSLNVAIGNKGRICLKIDVKGRSAHASRPNQGENAIYKAASVIEKIKTLNQELKEDSVSVTKIETPNKNINIIPDSCSIYCDYRSNIGREKKEILNKFMNIIGEKDKIKFVTKYYKPWSISEKHSLVNAALECQKKTSGKEKIIMWNFCTNGSYTAGELGLPTVGYGPGEESECHSPEEKVNITSVKTAEKYYSMLPEFIKN
ncbi:MAG: M20/M25/M40 family metallo-hydrolase [Elusimicrobiota bacterium]